VVAAAFSRLVCGVLPVGFAEVLLAIELSNNKN